MLSSAEEMGCAAQTARLTGLIISKLNTSHPAQIAPTCEKYQQAALCQKVRTALRSREIRYTIPHSLNLAEIHANIKTGLMRTMRKSKSCLTRNATLHINKIAVPLPIKQPNIPPKKVQSKLRETQDSWLDKIADGIQYHADNNNT